MAVTSIKVLRKASGSRSISGWSLEVYFRVTTNSENDGADVVLAPFQVGMPLSVYFNGTDKDILVSDGIPTSYFFPYPGKGCFGTDYVPPNPMYRDAVLVDATIVDRDANGTLKTQWVVSATYESSIDDEGYGSPPAVTPYFTYRDEVIDRAKFAGWYFRKDKELDNPCKTDIEGEWVFGFPPESDAGWVSKGPLADGGGVDAEDNIGNSMTPINSAGFRPTQPLMKKRSVQAFKLEWFSYRALNFQCHIGKVNSNQYCLKAWDSAGRPPWEPSHGNFVSPQYERPCQIFSQTFGKRELMIDDVVSTRVKWGGRWGYRYEVELLYDKDQHDYYMLDSGYDYYAGDGSEASDSGASGNELPLPDSNSSANDSQRVVGRDGIATAGEVLLNGRGGRLNPGTFNDEGKDPIYLKWRVISETPFPTDDRNEYFQYHNFGQVNDKGVAPLFMDAGQSITDPTQYEIPCQFTEEPPGDDSKYPNPSSDWKT